ncbi:hypothetical protein MMC19_002805 [Ptychographa xylographoides]|nr:hypothetical protein [Ptychographa xylographoides]
MVSKGIVVYSYISVEGYEVEFGVPGDRTVNTSADNHSAKDLEIESSKIPGLEHFTGRFIWRVLKNSLEIANRYNDINSLTGNLVGGNMKTTMENQSIFIGDIIISFGFYDAGTGRVGLTSKDQCYVTVTRNQSTWMGNLAPQGSTAASKPFSRFVMVAPHDDGMDTMQNSDAVINGLDVDSLVPLVKNVPELQWFDDLIPSEMLVHMLPNIVEALAVTQKDTTASMLALGARYFEFRPAFLVPVFQEISRLDNKLYFQHACIPGLAFDVFLDQVIAFLDTHVAEIVTIHLRWDNVISECRHPTMDELNAAIKQSLAKSNGFIKCGGIDCLTQPIDTLRANGTRLICIVEAQKYDSWTAAAYATLTAAPILERFESMNTEGQEAYPLTVLQCQATSQSIKEVLVYSAVAANASNSCLTETKAMLDQQTLPWIRDNLLQRLTAEKPVVVMNDFIDGATVDIAIGLSKARLDL